MSNILRVCFYCNVSVKIGVDMASLLKGRDMHSNNFTLRNLNISCDPTEVFFSTYLSYWYIDLVKKSVLVVLCEL